MNVGSNAKAGKGEYVVAEADESDGTFLAISPNSGVSQQYRSRPSWKIIMAISKI